MEIKVNRYRHTDDATVSMVFINDEFECFGLEDEPRTVKKYGETRIPAGTYKIEVRRVGGFHVRYKKRFPAFHEGMLWIKNVPGFEYILIHIGNDDDDTAGCLLLGRDVDEERMWLKQSTVAYTQFYKKVIEEAKSGNLVITFNDNDQG